MFDVVQKLLVWFRANARLLPWRAEPRDPYGVLVSELMLQQTQVDRVIPKYREFMASFPDLVALAEADEEEVLTVWSGLGYYRRARLLHRLARQVLGEGGQLPKTAIELESLPGVGPYTAAAVSSLVYGERVPVLDGNVIRVASRFLALSEDPRRAAGRRVLTAWLDQVLEAGPPGEVNEALMELGAIVCLPSGPRCGQCPLAGGCAAQATGCPEAYPRPRERRKVVHLRWVAACCVDAEGLWLVRRVTDGPILRGLWLPPIAQLAEGEAAVDRAKELVPGSYDDPPHELGEVRHSITHRRIRVLPVLLSVSGREASELAGRWIDPENSTLPTSSLLGKLFRINYLANKNENE